VNPGNRRRVFSAKVEIGQGIVNRDVAQKSLRRSLRLPMSEGGCRVRGDTRCCPNESYTSGAACRSKSVAPSVRDGVCPRATPGRFVARAATQMCWALRSRGFGRRWRALFSSTAGPSGLDYWQGRPRRFDWKRPVPQETGAVSLFPREFQLRLARGVCASRSLPREGSPGRRIHPRPRNPRECCMGRVLRPPSLWAARVCNR